MISIAKNFSYYILFFIALGLHIAFNHYHSGITPRLIILEDAPSPSALKIQALGDDEFLFRQMTIQLQNAGDTFGRFTALRDYDYQNLKSWLLALDTLDSKSAVLPALASYYYSNTQKVEDNKYLIEYLESNYEHDPAKKWWWMLQAVSIAQFKLKDQDLALRLSFKLMRNHNPKLPKWVRQMPAIIYSKIGEKQLAIGIMQELMGNYKDYTPSELEYIDLFIKNQ